MPKFAGDLAKYVQTFLERTYERCQTSYMEAVLEKQSYMLIGGHDIKQLMRLDPACEYLPNAFGQSNMAVKDVGLKLSACIVSCEVANEVVIISFNIKIMNWCYIYLTISKDNQIRDDNKLILLASLSDSLEYVAESIESFPMGFTSVHGESPSAEYAKLRKESLESEFGHALGANRSRSFSTAYRFGPFLALYRAAII